MTRGSRKRPPLRLRSRRAVVFAGIAAVVAVASWIGSMLGTLAWMRISYEAGGPATVDTPLYWTVGKGMLEGKQPYLDMFETKPPGIFLLSAVSYLITGTPALTHAAQIAALLAVASAGFVLLLLRWRDLRGARSHAVWIACLALLLPLPLMLYVAERSGEVQVESFGVGAAAAYCALIAWKIPSRWWHLLLASLCILCGVGFKEPFVFSFAAAAIVLSDSLSDFWHAFVLPAALAVAGGLLFLLYADDVSGYVGIYLDEMLHRQTNGGEGILTRAFDVSLAWNDARAFNGALPWFFASLFGISLVFKALRCRTWPGRFSVAAAHLAAMYLALVALSVGGPAYNHHYAFHVPVFVACAASIARFHMRNPSSPASFASVPIIFALLAFMGSTIVPPPYETFLQDIRREQLEATAAAETVDRIMESCGLDAYVYLGLHGYHPYAYTEKTPLGPSFFQFAHFFDGRRPYFEARMKANLQDVDLIVFESLHLGVMDDWAKEYIAGAFIADSVPWECAAGIRLSPSTDGYTIHFRARPRRPETTLTPPGSRSGRSTRA